MQLKLQDGESIRCKKLGSGCYSTAYQDSKNNDRVFLLTTPKDKSKDVLIAARKATGNQHLPELIDRGTTSEDGETVRVYETKFYKDIPVDKEGNSAEPISRKAQYKDVDSINSIIDIPQSVKDAFKAIDNVLKTMGATQGFSGGKGSIRLFYDTHVGNWGIDKYGTVILRDPIVVNERQD